MSLWHLVSILLYLSINLINYILFLDSNSTNIENLKSIFQTQSDNFKHESKTINVNIDNEFDYLIELNKMNDTYKSLCRGETKVIYNK